MDRPTLQAVKRETLGKNASHKGRVKGQIPAVVYHASSNKHINLEQTNILEVLKKYGDNSIVEIKLDNETIPSRIKEVQRDSISGQLIHIDFKSIDLNKKINAKVPVIFSGSDTLNKNGAVIQTYKNEVEIECNPDVVPKNINIDVSKRSAGDNLKVKDIKFSTEIAILENPEDIIAIVTYPDKTIEQ